MMLRHVVSWKFTESDPEKLADQLATVKERLLGLQGVVPSIQAMEFGINEVDPEANFDAVLIAEFADADGLHDYIVHPVHQEVASYVHSLVTTRAAVDFTV